MYKVLIVDDEKNIRLGIQAMVDREFSDVLETMVASDGMDALEKLDGQQIDILITDIRMPKMDGIQLMQQLQKSETKPAIIVLSGFDDFEYTKEAIKCQVKDYLLKPVNRNELFQTLRNVIEDLAVSTKSNNQQLNLIRTNELKSIFLNSSITEEEVERRCKKIDLDIFPYGYYVGRMQYNKMFDENHLINRMNQVLNATYGSEAEEFVRTFRIDDHIVMISSMEEVFRAIQVKMANEKHLGLSIGVSGKQKHIRLLREAYQQASEALKYHLLFPQETIFSYENVAQKQQSTSLPLDEMKKISNMLGTERDQEVKDMLLQVLCYENIANMNIQYLESVSQEINRVVFENFFAKLGEGFSELNNQYNEVKNIYHFRTFHEYYQAVEDLMMRIHEYARQMKSVYSEQKYMEKAKTYIKENFHKDLNLAVVSNHISLNYSYCSHMFKENTGLNFVDYLKKVRVEEAKKLLAHSDLKVFEISDSVGYKNPKQFARVFREIEGISPKEFREQQ